MPAAADGARIATGTWSAASRSAAAVTSRPERSAWYQPWPWARSAGASRAPSRIRSSLVRGRPLPRSPRRTSSPRDHGSRRARRSSPGLDVERPGGAVRVAHLDVEARRAPDRSTLPASADRGRRCSVRGTSYTRTDARGPLPPAGPAAVMPDPRRADPAAHAAHDPRRRRRRGPRGLRRRRVHRPLREAPAPAAGAPYRRRSTPRTIQARLPREQWPRTRTYTVRDWDPAQRADDRLRRPRRHRRRRAVGRGRPARRRLQLAARAAPTRRTRTPTGTCWPATPASSRRSRRRWRASRPACPSTSCSRSTAPRTSSR